MAKFIYDFEFLEGFVKKGFLGNKQVHSIQPIELGIIDEVGNSFKVIYKDFDTKAAWQHEWLRENVIKKWFDKEDAQAIRMGFSIGSFNYSWFKRYIKYNGKSRKEIRRLIREFIFGHYNNKYNDGMSFSDVAIQHGLKEEPIELISWFSAYDHVAFCNTFGTMMDLPNGFPMHTFDIEQEFDRKIQALWEKIRSRKSWTIKGNIKLEGIKNIVQLKEVICELSDFPVNKNPHDILSDIQYHKDLYYFIKTI